MRKDHIGIKIRERRKELGLKVYELANKVEINPVYVTQIEKHGKLPSPEIFLKIEAALNLNPEIRNQYFNDKFFESMGEDIFKPPVKTFSMEILEQLDAPDGESRTIRSYSRIFENHPDAPKFKKALLIVIKKFKDSVNEAESLHKILKKDFGNRGKPL